MEKSMSTFSTTFDSDCEKSHYSLYDRFFGMQAALPLKEVQLFCGSLMLLPILKKYLSLASYVLELNENPLSDFKIAKDVMAATESISKIGLLWKPFQKYSFYQSAIDKKADRASFTEIFIKKTIDIADYALSFFEALKFVAIHTAYNLVGPKMVFDSIKLVAGLMKCSYALIVEATKLYTGHIVDREGNARNLNPEERIASYLKVATSIAYMASIAFSLLKHSHPSVKAYQTVRLSLLILATSIHLSAYYYTQFYQKSFSIPLAAS
jgi:hypothetical protein